MPDPLFDSRTPRLDLPLLFAGQSQKEGYVNEIAARLDALMFLAIEGEAGSPPAAPEDGLNWLVGSNPSSAWSGQAGKIAARQAGNWLFVTPIPGMRLLNKASGQEIRYVDQWRIPARPALPSGGTTIDAEARAAIVALLAALDAAGVTATP